ncbi:MAG: quinolinate synthase NadA [Methanomicrobiaceae archaeon]|nr:quinolinate synthase NadA [Methanomicrobiaceae archaeon]
MIDTIRNLKKEKNAVILAHNYQLPEIQDVADFVGDSLELALRAVSVTERMIVFCGVQFMAETAKILNPEKKVILPVQEAGCPLANQLTPEMLHSAKAEHPGAGVVVYVNSTAECKAVADIVCTSANAVEVVRSLDADEIIFGPDANLAAFVQKSVPEKSIIPVPPTGHCYVHTGFTLHDVAEARARGGRIICHPECPPAIQERADVIASTGGMVRIAEESELWHVFTEKEMGYRLKTLHPGRTFLTREGAVCHDMKLTTLPILKAALETEEHEVTLPDRIMREARTAIERMIALHR